MVTHVSPSKSGRVFPEHAGRIKSVSVINTGWGEAHREHVYGSRKPTLWWILFGRRWVRVPINVYVVERSDGLILFDAGQDRAVVTDPGYWPDRITSFFMDWPSIPPWR